MKNKEKEKIDVKIKKLLETLKANSFTGIIQLKLVFNQGGVRDTELAEFEQISKL